MDLIPAVKPMAKMRTLTLITLLAFVINGLLPFFAVYTVPSAYADDQANFSSLFGGKILLCTSTGYKWVTWDELQREDHRPAPSKHFKCPLCFASAYGSKDFIASGKTPYPPAPQVLVYVLEAPEQTKLQDHLQLLDRLPRAPPFLA